MGSLVAYTIRSIAQEKENQNVCSICGYKFTLLLGVEISKLVQFVVFVEWATILPIALLLIFIYR